MPYRYCLYFSLCDMASQGKELRRFVEFGRKIIGVGKNYRQPGQNQESPISQNPLIFLKPPTTYLREGGSIKIPTGRDNVYYEVELGVVIGKRGAAIPEENAMDHVGGYTLALDMTDFDLILEKNEEKKLAYPWALAKGFDTATPVSEFIPKKDIPDPNNIRLWLKLDQEMRQDGNTGNMIYKIPYLISFVSQFMTLEEGDMFLTGTPEGGAPVKQGQKIVCGMDLFNREIQMTFPISS